MPFYNTIPACKDGFSPILLGITRTVYVIIIIALLIVGILQKVDIIEREEFEKESIWWYGVIGLVVIAVLGGVSKLFLINFPINSIIENLFWSLTHFFAYFALTMVSPGEWPFWLAIGIMFEFFECFLICWDPKMIGCNGYHDVVTNLAGIACAMWIKNNDSLKKCKE